MKCFRSKSLIFALTLLTLLSCGGRRPNPKTAQSVARSYFKSYGRKYDESRFGNKNVSSVTINGIEEISFNTVYADTVVEFNDGGAARTLLKMEKKFPGGWHVLSWEILEQQ